MTDTLTLTIDGAVNMILGTLLIWFPRGVANTLGLPIPDSPFYRAILGGVLVGIGAGLLLQQLLERPAASRGIELPISINLAGSGVLIGLLAAGHLSLPSRGKIFLWIVAILVLGIGAVELYLLARRTQ